MLFKNKLFKQISIHIHKTKLFTNARFLHLITIRKEILKSLKCKWAPSKKEWYYRPEEHKSVYNRKTHTIEEIREMYGTNGQRKAKGKKQLEKTN